MRTKFKFTCLMLAVVMVFTVVPVVAVSEEAFIFDERVIRSAEELEYIFTQAMEGTFIGDDTISVEYLGAVDGWDRVVQITETVHSVTARNGDSYEYVVRSVIAHNERHSQQLVAPSFWLTGSIGWAVRRGQQGEEIQLRWYSASVFTTVGQFRPTRLLGEATQWTLGGTERKTFNVPDIRVPRTNTGFNQWASIAFVSMAGLNVRAQYVCANTGRIGLTPFVNVTVG